MGRGVGIMRESNGKGWRVVVVVVVVVDGVEGATGWEEEDDG